MARNDDARRREHGKFHALLVASGAIGLVMVGALVGGVVLLSGTVSTAATKQHFLLTHRLLDAAGPGAVERLPQVQRVRHRVEHRFWRHVGL